MQKTHLIYIYTLYIAFMFYAFSLLGCSDSGSLNLSSLPVNGQEITAISGNIKDASAQKEALFFDAVKNRDNVALSAYSSEGLNIEFEIVEIKGVFIQVLRSLRHKEPFKFAQPLPNGPSEHPFWKFATTFATKALDVTLWYTAIKELGSVFSKQTDKVGTTYNGNYDYRPSTAQPYVYNFTP